MTGHWPRHGYHYFTEEHYRRLVSAQGYRLLELCNAPCLGNFIDSWQIYAVLQKCGDPAFMPILLYEGVCHETVFTS
jgi:hypothetical protein